MERFYIRKSNDAECQTVHSVNFAAVQDQALSSLDSSSSEEDSSSYLVNLKRAFHPKARPWPDLRSSEVQ